MNKPSIWIVILNYNDFESTFNLFNKIKSFNYIDKIIIVDNASTDTSFKSLSNIIHQKLFLIQSNTNGGYGYGNNLGLRKAIDSNVDYVLIANPDVSFEEKTLFEMISFISVNQKCVAVSPKINSNHFAYKSAPALLDIFHSSLLFNKIIKPRYYRKSFFDNANFKRVFALPGSLVLFDLKKFEQCGLYDENIFLYHEEHCLGEIFQKYDYESYVLLDVSYEHKKSSSVKKNIKSSIRLKNIILNSHRYYLKNYKKNSLLPVFILDLMKPFMILEFIVWSFMKKFLYLFGKNRFL